MTYLSLFRVTLLTTLFTLLGILHRILSRYNFLRLVIVGTFLLTYGQLTAQDWMVRTSANFSIYYESEDVEILDRLDSLCLAELSSLEVRLNYHTGNPINVFLSNHGDYTKSYEVGSGEIYIESQSIHLNVYSSFSSIAISFRSQAVEVLVNEMMYGGSLQDKIKSSNLINLPDWVIPGLYHYLGYNWSVHTDNTMRYIEDEYGLADFNQIPEKYNHIKGAAFWKFIEYKYGNNAIPTVLYMARLTRKFNASIYYSFQTNLYDLFSDWKDYYSTAYRADQSKPNPIEGIELDKASLYDICVESSDTFYTLQTNFLGTSLYRYVYDGEYKKDNMYTLKSTESPVGVFQKSLYIEGNAVKLVLIKGDAVVIKSFSDEKSIEQVIPLKGVSTVCTSSQGMLLVVSKALSSVVYKYSGSDNLERVLVADGFIKSVSIDDDILVYVTTDMAADSLIGYDMVKHTKTQIFNSIHGIDQIIALGDSAYLYNSASNGISNGKLLDARLKQNSLTNYRYNILFHQYTDKIFAEYLDRGTHSALFITDHIDARDFFKYDSLYETTFYQEVVFSKSDKAETRSFSNDSLSYYTFQAPVYPSTDFESSNYDSLYLSKLAGVKNKDVSKAQEYISVSAARFQLTNSPFQGDNSVFEGAYKLRMPSSLNISLGATFINQYHTKEIGLFYTGLVQLGARDIQFYYKQKGNWDSEVQLFSRKRTFFSDAYRESYHTAQGSYMCSQSRWSDKITVSHSVEGRYDRASPLYVSQESIASEIRNSLLIGYTSRYKFQSTSEKHRLRVDLALNPQVSVLASGYSVTADIHISHKLNISTRDQLLTSIKLGTSQGSAPSFFMLGGAAGDVLIKDENRSFSEYKQAALYTNLYGIRGFNANYRNGNTFCSMQTQFESKVLEYVLKRPITAEVFANLKGHVFIDVATAFYGSGIYDEANVLSTSKVESSTKALLIEINAYKNPIIASTGVGASTFIYGYKVSFDYAFGLEERKFKTPVLHLSLGHSF